MSNITIKGDGNKTSLVIASSNSSINAGDTIEDYIIEYIKEIQNYIRDFLANVLTNDFITSNNVAKTKSEIIRDIELCWVGEQEHFLDDINDKNIDKHGAKIFSHFTQTSNQDNTHYITLQTRTSDVFVTIPTPITFKSDIFSKIQYVNSKVPDEIKDYSKYNRQGPHTLGLINNTISFPITNPITGLTSSKSVKTILNSEYYGITKYYGLDAYNAGSYWFDSNYDSLYVYNETFYWLIVKSGDYAGIYYRTSNGTRYQNIKNNGLYFYAYNRYQLGQFGFKAYDYGWYFVGKLNLQFDITNLFPDIIWGGGDGKTTIVGSTPILINGYTNIQNYRDQYNLYSYLNSTYGYVNLNYYAVQYFNTLTNNREYYTKKADLIPEMYINLDISNNNYYWYIVNNIYYKQQTPSLSISLDTSYQNMTDLVYYTNNNTPWVDIIDYNNIISQYTNKMQYINQNTSRIKYLQVAVTPIIMYIGYYLTISQKQYIISCITSLLYALYNNSTIADTNVPSTVPTSINDFIIIEISVKLVYYCNGNNQSQYIEIKNALNQILVYHNIVINITNDFNVDSKFIQDIMSANEWVKFANGTIKYNSILE